MHFCVCTSVMPVILFMVIVAKAAATSGNNQSCQQHKLVNVKLKAPGNHLLVLRIADTYKKKN